MEAVFILNTNTLFLEGLHEADRTSDEDFVTDAEVSATLLDADGEEIAGQTWPVTLDYVADSEGDYTASLSADLDVDEDDEGTIVVDFTSGSKTGRIERPCRFIKRTG